MFNFLKHFRDKGFSWMRARLSGIRGKWGEEYAWIGSLEVRLNALWAWVTTLWATVTAWISSIYAAFVAWAQPIIIWVQAKVGWLLAIYSTYIEPVLDWVEKAVKWATATILLVQGRLEELIKFIYGELFGWVEDIRVKITTIFGKIKDLASIFSQDLANSIQATEDKFFRLLDSFTRDIRDWALTSIHAVTDPAVSKLNQISIFLDGYIKKVEDSFKGIDDFIAKTFEAPKLLHKDTVEATGLKYGQELWESMFKALTPELGPGESQPVPFSQLPEWLDRTRKNIVAGEEGEWDDVTRRITEEVSEIITGTEIERKTELNLPGAGGGW